MPALDGSTDTPDRRGRSARRILLGLLAGLGLYVSWRILQPFVTVILWAGVLALLFKPLHRRMVVRTSRPNLAATITLVVALVSVLLPLAAVSLGVANEIGKLVDEAPAKWKTWVSDPRNRESLSRFRQDLSDRFPFAGALDEERIKGSVACADHQHDRQLPSSAPRGGPHRSA